MATTKKIAAFEDTLQAADVRMAGTVSQSWPNKEQSGPAQFKLRIPGKGINGGSYWTEVACKMWIDGENNEFTYDDVPEKGAKAVVTARITMYTPLLKNGRRDFDNQQLSFTVTSVETLTDEQYAGLVAHLV